MIPVPVLSREQRQSSIDGEWTANHRANRKKVQQPSRLYFQALPPEHALHNGNQAIANSDLELAWLFASRLPNLNFRELYISDNAQRSPHLHPPPPIDSPIE